MKVYFRGKELTSQAINANLMASEEERKLRESARESAELEREENESTRIETEGVRRQAEEQRLQDESTRLYNEEQRVIDEQTRKNNETNRQQTFSNNESTRQSGEDTRLSNEQTRVSNEGSRVTAEELRVTAEGNRQTASQQAVTNANNAAANANQAAEDVEFFEERLIAVENMIIDIADIEDWNIVLSIVDNGLGRKAFPVGTQFVVNHSVHGELVYDVVAHDHHKNVDNPDAHTMTVVMHDCIYGRQIDNSELLWVNSGEEELAAGTYNLTLLRGAYGGGTGQDGTYQFTTTQPIPVGGGIRHSVMGAYQSTGYTKAQITGGTFTTYGANRAVIESGRVTTEGSGGTSLGIASRNNVDTVSTKGIFNSTERNAYGSNNYDESALRQWINSDAAANAWWESKTIFDMAPTYANVAGFVNGLDPEFVAILGEVDNVTIKNTVFEADGVRGGSYSNRDKFFLLSMTELGIGNNNSIAEGSILEFYVGAAQVDRIKYDITAKTTARYWWFRSPDPSTAGLVRGIRPDGSLHILLTAYNGLGAAPACVITKSQNLAPLGAGDSVTEEGSAS